MSRPGCVDHAGRRRRRRRSGRVSSPSPTKRKPLSRPWSLSRWTSRSGCTGAHRRACTWATAQARGSPRWSELRAQSRRAASSGPGRKASVSVSTQGRGGGASGQIHTVPNAGFGAVACETTSVTSGRQSREIRRLGNQRSANAGRGLRSCFPYARGSRRLDSALLVLLVRSSYPVAALEDYRFDGTGRLLLRKRPPPGGPAGWRVARRPTPANDRPCLPLAVSILAQFSVTRVCEVGSAHRCEPGISSIRIDRAREIGALRLGWEPGSEFVRGWLVVPDETARWRVGLSS